MTTVTTGTVARIDYAATLSARTKAIILPHAFGLAAGAEAFAAMGVPVIEDCAQAIGALDAGRPAGSRGALAGGFRPRGRTTRGAGRGGVTPPPRSTGAPPPVGGPIPDPSLSISKRTFHGFPS